MVENKNLIADQRIAAYLDDCKSATSHAVVQTVRDIGRRNPVWVLVSGTSGKQVVMPWFETAWQALFEYPHPDIVDLGHENKVVLYKAKAKYPHTPHPILPHDYLKENFPKLLEFWNGPLVFLDDCSVTGLKAMMINQVFDDMGFRAVHYKVFVALECGVSAGMYDGRIAADLSNFINGCNDQLINSYVASVCSSIESTVDSQKVMYDVS